MKTTRKVLKINSEKSLIKVEKKRKKSLKKIKKQTSNKKARRATVLSQIKITLMKM